MVAEKRDLWIFPAQDSFAYQVPVPSLGVIYDLMHRYEPSFPEVGAWGRAKRRDRHYRDLGRYSRGILVDSEIGKKQAIESYGIPPGRLHVLPYVAPVYVDSVSGCDLPKGINLPRKYIFYPAQFWRHKNHGRLIEAVARLKPGLPDLRLVLAGSRKNGYKDVLELCRRKGVEEAVIFLGYVPEILIPGLYSHARALVFPTFFGPTNIPPLEAFAMGCPVACSNVYGMPDQLGDAALMFSPTSVDEIAAAIERVWTDDQLCARLAEKGRARSAAWGRTQFQAQFRVILGTILAQSC